MVDVVIQSLDIRFCFLDMDKCALDRRTVAADRIGDEVAVHADATHMAVYAPAVAEQTVNAFLFVIYTVILVIDAPLVQPLLMEFLHLFNITAAECFVGKTPLVFALERVDEIFFLV